MIYPYRKCGVKLIFGGVISLITFILVILSFLNSNSQETIMMSDIMANLHRETKKNITFKSNKPCDYRKILKSPVVLSSAEISNYDNNIISGVKIGGMGVPRTCAPLFSTAIIVPFGKNIEVIHQFLFYLHIFLRKQLIHYQIYIVDQTTDPGAPPFSRSMLMNVGAMTAMKDGYPCLIFHDLDLLPLKPANLYVCTKNPRHMTTKVSYKLLYKRTKYSSVMAITSKQFRDINGMSNKCERWAEHLASRIRREGLSLCKFERHLNQYQKKFFNSKDMFPFGRRTSSAIAITSRQFSRIDGMINDRDGWAEDLLTRLRKRGIVMCQFENYLNKYETIQFEKEKKKADDEFYEEIVTNFSVNETFASGLSSLNNLIVQTYPSKYTTHIIVHKSKKADEYKKMLKFEVDIANLTKTKVVLSNSTNEL